MCTEANRLASGDAHHETARQSVLPPADTTPGIRVQSVIYQEWRLRSAAWADASATISVLPPTASSAASVSIYDSFAGPAPFADWSARSTSSNASGNGAAVPVSAWGISPLSRAIFCAADRSCHPIWLLRVPVWFAVRATGRSTPVRPTIPSMSSIADIRAPSICGRIADPFAQMSVQISVDR